MEHAVLGVVLVATEGHKDQCCYSCKKTETYFTGGVELGNRPPCIYDLCELVELHPCTH